MGTSEKKTSGFLKQGSILAAASILVRIIGMIYRIPMANIIGDEGNGIYSAAFEIYNILLIISSYGMPMAVSKMVSAKCSEKKYREAYHTFRCSMVVAFVTGGSAALFMYFGADFLEAKLFASYRGVAIPLRVLSPTIFIVAVMGVLRGLYQGRKTMMPTAVSQIIEQIVNAFVSVAAAYSLMRTHSASAKISAWGAAGGTLGTCIGALSALLILVFIYVLYKPVIKKQERRDSVSAKETLGATYRLIFATVIPIVLSQTVYQLSGIIDVTIFNSVMAQKNFDKKDVSTLLGIYSTKYKILVSVPIAVSTAIASSMIPGMVAAFIQKNIKEVHARMSIAVKFNMIIAFPSAVGLSVLGTPIVKLLFPASDYVVGGTMLMTGSVCIVFYALSTVTNGVLQSVDKMTLPVWHAFVSLVVHVLLLYVLLKFTNLGAYALVVGNVTYPILVCILNHRSVCRCTGYEQEVTRTFCVPFLASVAMGAVAWLLYQGVFYLTGSNLLSLMPSVIAAVLLYFVLVLKLKGLTRQELYEFPMGRRMSVLADRLHLL